MLSKIRDDICRRRPCDVPIGEAQAIFQIVERLFELAAGAAINLEWPDVITRPLVDMVEHIYIILELNFGATLHRNR